jgi:hypothetical protein
VEQYAVGFARPDRWVQQGHSADQSRPWHAVEAHRPVTELDGEVELAVCGAIVQVWGAQHWERVGAGRTACQECRRLTSVSPGEPEGAGVPVPTGDGAAPDDAVAPVSDAPPAPPKPGGRRLRVVS